MEAAAKKCEFKKDPNDPCASKFGDLPLNRSQGDPELRFTKKFEKILNLDESKVGQDVIIRGRIHNSRGTGGQSFMVLRDQYSTVQANLFVDEKNPANMSKGMVEYSRKLPKESIIEVKAKVVKAEKDIVSCT